MTDTDYEAKARDAVEDAVLAAITHAAGWKMTETEHNEHDGVIAAALDRYGEIMFQKGVRQGRIEAGAVQEHPPARHGKD